MSLQRQHFLLGYLKTLSVGPAEILNLRPPTQQYGVLPTELTGRRFANDRGYLKYIKVYYIGYTTRHIHQSVEIENITCLRVDMNFIFECSTRYIELNTRR